MLFAPLNVYVIKLIQVPTSLFRGILDLSNHTYRDKKKCPKMIVHIYIYIERERGERKIR